MRLAKTRAIHRRSDLRPDSDFPTRTFPGASARSRFDVTTATIIAMRLSLNGFDRTSHLNPGSDPDGAGKEAHQISPRLMTQGLFLRGGNRVLETRGCRSVDGVELGGHRRGSPRIQICSERIRIELASGKFELPGEMLASLKDRVRNGNCHLHGNKWYHHGMTAARIVRPFTSSLRATGSGAHHRISIEFLLCPDPTITIVGRRN